uniref:SCAN box domain-containing protein n=1 Tax=Mastacembelus armatus TaxID=205130 RepID=A0A7N8YF56_9TELE
MRNKQLEVEAIHLKVRALELEQGAAVATSPYFQSPFSRPQDGFDVSRHIALVPPFRESEVDSYFSAFERIAATLNWPRNVRPLLLQCKFVGKAQEVCASLCIEDSLDYDKVKATVLRAYELVPEAYRQKFRNCEKTVTQTYVEFAREKGVLFDKWCRASKVKTLDNLRELKLLEEFKNRVPEKIVLYLNEQKVTSLDNTAVMADEFALTHKNVFAPFVRPDLSLFERKNPSPRSFRRTVPATAEKRECFYCPKQGHLIAVCPVQKRKEQNKTVKFTKSSSPVALIQTPPPTMPLVGMVGNDKVDNAFKPFVTQGLVSLENESTQIPITILRDTGAKQSVLRDDMLPFSTQSYCGSDILMWGVEMNIVRTPLHFVQLTSRVVSGKCRVVIRAQLPIEGVDLILGNDLAGGQVFPSPEVVESPTASACVSDVYMLNSPVVFPVRIHFTGLLFSFILDDPD